jgi:hypothetical protein
MSVEPTWAPNEVRIRAIGRILFTDRAGSEHTVGMMANLCRRRMRSLMLLVALAASVALGQLERMSRATQNYA